MHTKQPNKAVTLIAPLMLLGLFGTGSSVAGDFLAQADAQRAEAKLQKCARCHGDNGVSDDPEVPHLAGQSAGYLFTQIQHFVDDKRDGGRMNKMVRKLDQQMRADLAKYYATQTLPYEEGVTLPQTPALVDKGDPGRGLESCASCHGDDGRGKQGKFDAPSLAGMPKTYFTGSMGSFADGSRTTDKDQVMQKAAKALSEAEIESLADYYLALGKRKPL